MSQKRNWLVGLAVAMAAMIGVATAANAAIPGEEGYSYTSPAAELVVPYDVQDDRVSFIVVSNVSDRDVSTHWTFWNESCAEEVDFSICLTKNDTVVVDPRNMQAVNANNEAVGPRIVLDGTRGVATVIAYESEDNCAGYPASNKIADEALVGAFTFADTSVGYSFGNDALGLGTDYGSDPSVQVPEPAEGNSWEYAIQVFKPENVENSLVMLTHLAETSSGIVAPGTPAVKFATSVVDTYEAPTSLPDTSVSCSSYYSVTGGSTPFIPDETAVDSSGVILLQPVGAYPVAGTSFVYGIVGQAVLDFGASASVKVNEVKAAPLPPAPSYDCEGTICALKQDGSGEYATMASCEAACDRCGATGDTCGLLGSAPCCEALVCGEDNQCGEALPSEAPLWACDLNSECVEVAPGSVGSYATKAECEAEVAAGAAQCGDIVGTMEEYLAAAKEAVKAPAGTNCNYRLSKAAAESWASSGTFAVVSFSADPDRQFGYGSTNRFSADTRPLWRVVGPEKTGGAVAATWANKGITVDNLNNGDPTGRGACGAGSLGGWSCRVAVANWLFLFNTDGSVAACDPEDPTLNKMLLTADEELVAKNGTVSATFKNQFVQMNKTFGGVFGNEDYCADVTCEGGTPGTPWYECPALELASSAWWNRDPDNSDSWTPAFDLDKEFRDTPEGFQKVSKQLFGGADTAQAAQNSLTSITVGMLRGLGAQTLCTEPLAVRTYLWVIMDSNGKNQGNGPSWDNMTAGNLLLAPERYGNDGWVTLDLTE